MSLHGSDMTEGAEPTYIEDAAPAVVQLRDVTKKFGPIVAVDDVSLVVRKGQIVSLLGPSGCGKTTTLMVIAGFEQPDSGTVLIAGEDMRGRRPYERNVGLVFQDYALFPHMSVRENIAYGLRRRGIDRAEIPQRIKSMLQMVELEAYEGRWPKELSGGQQQRVALARALVTQPEVVLLDEPLSALDAKLRQELRIELKKILKAVGSTTIVVTHDQQEAMTLAEHIIVMSEGRIVQQGTPSEIYFRPESRFVAEFIGRSNWFDGQLGQEVASGIHEFHSARGMRLYVSAPSRRNEGRYDVCVRPERIVILEDEESSTAEPPHTNILSGRIVQLDLLGGMVELLVELDCGAQLCVIDKSRGHPLDVTDRPVRLKFGAADCIAISN